MESTLLGTLTRAHAALGDRDQALALAREAIALDERRDCKAPRALFVLAEVLLTLEDATPIPKLERSLEQARDMIEEVGQPVYLPHLGECEAAFARLREDAGARERCLHEAIGAAREFGLKPRAARLEAERARS